MAKSCPVGQVFNTKIGKCVKKKGGQKQKMHRIENETALRLESLVPKGRRMTMGESRKVGKRRKGVSDPRFHRSRGDKKIDPQNIIGQAIGKDAKSRAYKKWMKKVEKAKKRKKK